MTPDKPANIHSRSRATPRSSALSPYALLARHMRLGALLVVGAVATVVAAGNARADGDPASDVLYTGRVFVPYNTNISASAQKALTTTIARAEKAGYPIRVALIAQPSDLGAVANLWGKPREYARFLDIELQYIYKGPLLIVMPAGPGFAHYHHPTASDYRILASLPAPTGHDGLAITAINAVSTLATRAGHAIPAVTPSTHTGGGKTKRKRILAGSIVLILLGATFVLLTLRRRRHHT